MIEEHEDRELTDEELDSVVGGYKPHGRGCNSGKGKGKGRDDSDTCDHVL